MPKETAILKETCRKRRCKMLEEKTQELLNVQAELADMDSKQKEELAPLHTEIKRINGEWSQNKAQLQRNESVLKDDILREMTEKSHKFDCATITKRINKGLTIYSPLELFKQLKEINLAKLVTFGFKKADVIKAIELGALVLPAEGEVQFAEITETESLVVRKN